jgi:hypothetical protein
MKTDPFPSLKVCEIELHLSQILHAISTHLLDFSSVLNMWQAVRWVTSQIFEYLSIIKQGT